MEKFFRNWWPCLTIYHLQKNRSCDFLELLIFNFWGYLTVQFCQTSQLHWWSQCLSFLILNVCHTIQKKKAKQNTALLSIVANLHWLWATPFSKHTLLSRNTACICFRKRKHVSFVDNRKSFGTMDPIETVKLDHSMQWHAFPMSFLRYPESRNSKIDLSRDYN